jgi:hypothetical protein
MSATSASTPSWSPRRSSRWRKGFDQLGTALERSLTIVVRTAPGAGSPDALLRSAVASVDPQQPVGAIRPMETLIAQSVARASYAFETDGADDLLLLSD